MDPAWVVEISLIVHFFGQCLQLGPVMLVAQSCPTFCDPIDCSLPGSSVHGILQARVLEWVAIPFSRGSSWPRDRTWVSWITGRFFAIWATREYWAQYKEVSRIWHQWPLGLARLHYLLNILNVSAVCCFSSWTGVWRKHCCLLFIFSKWHLLLCGKCFFLIPNI